MAFFAQLPWAGSARALRPDAQPSSDLPCLARFVERGAAPAAAPGQSLAELRAIMLPTSGRVSGLV